MQGGQLSNWHLILIVCAIVWDTNQRGVSVRLHNALVSSLIKSHNNKMSK